MDNRIFNVNGKGDDMMLATLQLVFLQAGLTCNGWRQTQEHGLILCWSNGHEQIIPFPAELTAGECLPFVSAWLAGDYAKTVVPGEGCSDLHHDGHNSKGWQIYCDGWGHVGGEQYSICGVRPAFLWYGK